MNRKIKKAAKKFERFNNRAPKRVKRISLDLQTPLVKIGEIPEIVYVSNKEGKRRAYKHKVSRPFPTLYGSPDGKFFVMIGGNIKIKDWLYN